MMIFRRWQGAAAALITLWIALSGQFSGQFLLLGLASCGLVLWLSARMRLGGEDAGPMPRFWGALGYACWLMREIFLSNIKVARIILDPNLPVSPVLFLAPASQKTALGRVMFANSIILTPGTISIDFTGQGDQILVHALHGDMSWGAEGCGMDARVSALGI